MLLVFLAVYVLRDATGGVALELLAAHKIKSTGGMLLAWKCSAEIYHLVEGHDVAAQIKSQGS